MAYALARTPRLSLEGFAARSGQHPDLIRRFIALGLLRAARDPAGRLWLPPGELDTVARILRLRAGLALNYAAIGLVLDLLARIDDLERRREGGIRSWTPTG